MIRKLVFSTLILFSVFWLVSGFILKSSLQERLTSEFSFDFPEFLSDKIEVGFDQISLSGYPLTFRYDLRNFVIKIYKADYVRVIRIPEFAMFFDLFKSKIVFKKKGEVSYATDVEESESQELDLRSNLLAVARIDGINALNLSLKNTITELELLPNIVTLKDEKKNIVAELDINNLIIKPSYNENGASKILYEISLGYKNKFDAHGFSSALIDCNLKYKTTEHKTRELKVNDFSLILDEESSISINGGVILPNNEGDFPKGSLYVMMNNYEAFIDKVLPLETTSERAAGYKAIITRAGQKRSLIEQTDAGDEKINKIDFDIVFTENNIKFGNLELKDFYDYED